MAVAQRFESIDASLLDRSSCSEEGPTMTFLIGILAAAMVFATAVLTSVLAAHHVEGHQYELALHRARVHEPPRRRS